MANYNTTEDIIESISTEFVQRQIVLNALYLTDEDLPEGERRKILAEIFNRNIRETQVQATVSYLAPMLRKIYPQSALIYGPTGSGKTVTLIHVLSAFQKVADNHNIMFNYVYVDLTQPKSVFGAFNELAMALDGKVKRYRKGIPIDYMQGWIAEALNKYDGFFVLLIDEVDNIKPRPDDFLIFLAKTLPRKVKCRLVLIMLTNCLGWEKSLDPRIMSVLKKHDIIFAPYNAHDLLEILKLRVEKALDGTKVDESALKKIAAYASRETGDARKAVELLAKSVKVAERTSGRLTESEVDKAEQMIEVDKSEELIHSLAPQQYFTLLACYLSFRRGKKRISTGEAYEVYCDICTRDSTRPLTQRRFADMVSYLDLFGLVSARPVTLGRYGNTREISSSLPPDVVQRFLHSRD